MLPGLFFVERLLAKEAYDGEFVARFVLSIMDLSDGIHLHCHIIEEDDGFYSKRFDHILATNLEGLRILA